MSKPKTPRHKIASIHYKFEHGSENINLIEQTVKLIMQSAQMAASDDPVLKEAGIKKIKTVAEFCVAGQFFLPGQKDKSKKPRRAFKDGDGEKFSIKALVGDLLKQYPDSLASDLMPHIYSELKKKGLDPAEEVTIINKKNKDEKVNTITFDNEGKRASCKQNTVAKYIWSIKKDPI